MMLKENDALARFDSIVKAFAGTDRVALCHDLDADGISSGVLAYLGIQRVRGKEPDLVITQPYKTVELLKESIELLRKNKIQKLVVVDFAFDQKPESIERVEEIVEQILVIDHHKMYAEKDFPKTLIVKPQLVSEIEPSQYPCAKLVYDLFSRHCDLSSHSWVACVGLIGDNQLDKWKEFVGETTRKHNTTAQELWKVMEIISAVEVLAHEKLQELLLFIVHSKSPKDVLSSRFAKYSARLKKQVDAIYKKFRAEKEVYKNEELVWFAFKAKKSIKSAVINKASNELYPDKTLVFVQDRGNGFIDFSARRQDMKVKTNELLENAVEGFEKAGAGGHVPASAGRIMKKDLPEFKKRVLKFLLEKTFSQ